MAWSYWEYGGVGAWSEAYPLANGKRQSPIDISNWENDPKLSPKMLQFTYDPADLTCILNTGKSWQLKTSADAKSRMHAAHLSPKPFQLLQVHGHWGSGLHDGSEHTINGRSFAAEIHLVHWNKKYNSPEEASKHPDGLAVLGILLEQVEIDNRHFAGLVEMIKSIQYKNEQCQCDPSKVDLEKWLPTDRSFFTYEGSLTTPPCSEVVLWTVFKEPVPISRSQLQLFRSMSCGMPSAPEAPRLVNNVRPVQPVGNRTVRFSAG